MRLLEALCALLRAWGACPRQPYQPGPYRASDRNTASLRATTGLWGKQNMPSGVFDEVKRSGDPFRGVRREN